MEIKASRRVSAELHMTALKKVYQPYSTKHSNNKNICKFWLSGQCNRNPCSFLHSDLPRPLTYQRNQNQPRSSPEDSVNRISKLVIKRSHPPAAKVAESQVDTTVTNKEKATQIKNEIVCKKWLLNKCTLGDKCPSLHSWFLGEGLTRFAQLEGHKKAIIGITLPSGSDKLYTASSDRTVRVWDCNSGQCVNLMNQEEEIGSLMSEGPWVFVGLPNIIKAWNLNTLAEHSLTGPAGQVYAMAVGKETFFAGAQNGAILAYKSSSDSESFHLAATMKGHNRSVVSLTVGKDRLYSGSTDLKIKVWDIDTFHCLHTLDGHSQAVTSLLCWSDYLLSSSLDGTIKVWAATESGTVEVTYTHKQNHGLLALCGIHDTEGKPILLCSCKDNSVRLLELPTFTERGTLFAKQGVRTIQVGPDGLFFTGDGTGELAVWKMLPKTNVEAASSTKTLLS